jgi:hypothetical protein
MDDGYPMNKDAMVTREWNKKEYGNPIVIIMNWIMIFLLFFPQTHTDTRTHVAKASGFAFMGFSITCLGPDCGL